MPGPWRTCGTRSSHWAAPRRISPPHRSRRDYIAGPELLAAVMAEDRGRVIGWQSVEMWQAEAHGGTFVQPGTQANGVGAAMFAMAREVVRLAGVRAIIAGIRADNVPGLACYGRMGFVEFARDPEFAPNDGRVHRRFDLV